MTVTLETGIVTWGIGALVTVGIAWGTVKSRLGSFLTYKDHQEICHSAIKNVFEVIDELRKDNKEMFGMIREMHGSLKARKALDDTNG